MAEKLTPSQGAGGQKRSSRPPKRLKAKPHEAPPRRSSPAAAAAAQPTDAQIRQGQQDRLVALHGRHRAVDNRLAVAREAVSVIALEKKEIRAGIQNAGFPLALYDEAYGELKLKTKRTDLEQKEEIRGLIREALGLPCGPQPRLELEGVPDAARPTIHWEGVGYQAGIGGETSDPTRDGCPPENLQDYMRGYSQAMARNGAGIKALKADARAPKIPPAPAPQMVGETTAQAEAREAARGTPAPDPLGQPDWTGYDPDPALWSEPQREAFNTWFDGLAVDADVTIEHPGVAIAFDRRAEAESGPEEGQAGEPAVSEMFS